MKTYKHKQTGEKMKVYPGQSVGEVLAKSASWELVKEPKQEPETAPDKKDEPDKKPAGKKAPTPRSKAK